MLLRPCVVLPKNTGRWLRQAAVAAGLLGLLLHWPLAGPAAANHYFFPRVYAQLERQVKIDMRRQEFTCRGEPICSVQYIPAFYEQRSYRPVWFDGHGLRPAAHSLMGIIGQAFRDGLRPSDYHLPAINRLLDMLNLEYFPPDEALAPIWAELDLLLTDAWLQMGTHLAAGRINPEHLHEDWVIPDPPVDMLTVLTRALAEDSLEATIDRLRPTHREYRGLQQALQRLRRIQQDGGWPVIAAGETIRPGDVDERVASLWKRLHTEGDLTADTPPDASGPYDTDLVAAVEHFQRRHGLKPDGIIGPETLGALNVDVGSRIRQIELNLERWRWLPRDLGERYIAVNTAAFELAVVEKDRKALTMRVVVGKPARMTPVFSARLSYMVLNPYWNVPFTLATEDILPKLAQGADYLVDKGFKVFGGWEEDAEELDPRSVDWSRYDKSNFPFRLRQEPGEKNALGRIKFMLPNKFAVYLHDTPQKSLFRRFQRGYSSGCIRVEHARELALYLLSGDSTWTSDRLDDRLGSGERQVVHIPDPIPVHLLYMTAWVDENGDLQFRDDIYGRDGDLDRALQRRSNHPAPPRVISTESLHS